MKRVAKFEKVSAQQFLEGWMKAFPESSKEEATKIYEEIMLPLPDVARRGSMISS